MSSDSGPKDRAKRAVVDLEDAARARGIAKSLDEIGDTMGARLERIHADSIAQQAQRELVVRAEDLARGPGGEVAIDEAPGTENLVGWYLKDTLENPDLVNAMASRNRMELALDVGAGCLNAALDAAETVEARDALERMAAHQMAAAHEAAMKAIALGVKSIEDAARCGRQAQVEGCRLLNTAARLMSAYSSTMSALAKVRSGGRQEVVVQHVNVTDGGQAVVAGSVGSPGAGGGGARR